MHTTIYHIYCPTIKHVEGLTKKGKRKLLKEIVHVWAETWRLHKHKMNLIWPGITYGALHGPHPITMKLPN